MLIRLVGLYLNFINAISKRLGAKHSFYVFCYPFKIKLSASQQSFLRTAEQFRLPMDKFELQCYKWGNGSKKVLLVHGWSSNSFRWKRYITHLVNHGFTVYSFDAPGHGNSGSLFGNVPLFARAIETIYNHIDGIELLVGHSVGGFASIYFLHTNKCHNIQRFATLAAPGSANDFIDSYINALKLSKRTEANLRSYFIKYTGKKVEQFNIEQTMDNMPEHGLIIHDEGDEDVPVKYAKAMKRIWPSAKLVITNGLGHKLRDQRVIDEVMTFLNS